MLETIMQDEELKAIINSINNVIIVNNCGSHGLDHVLRVMKYVEILLRGVGADEKEVELGKVAA